jgi:hypothetical protein
MIVDMMMLDNAIETGQQRLAHPEEGMVAQVLAYDVVVGFPEFRSDTVLLEAACYALSGKPMRAMFAMPYRPATSDKKLVLHDFRLTEFSGDAETTAPLRAGLFSRMEEAPDHWHAYYVNENSAEHLAERRAVIPPVPWEDPEVLTVLGIISAK